MQMTSLLGFDSLVLRTVLRPAALALLLAAFAVPALAQWTWRDASGQINASDRPPPREVPEKDILSRPVPQAEVRRPAPPADAASAPAAPAAAPAARNVLEREVDARKRAAEQEQAARQRAGEQKLAEQRAENCRRARTHVAALESGQRIARTNDKGEREVLDDKGRADEMRRARQVVASDCR
jgi:type IV secretory pathway VirB10-like protein